MIDHDALMLSLGILLMAANLLGAAFTVRRLRSRRRAVEAASRGSIQPPFGGATGIGDLAFRLAALEAFFSLFGRTEGKRKIEDQDGRAVKNREGATPMKGPPL